MKKSQIEVSQEVSADNQKKFDFPYKEKFLYAGLVVLGILVILFGAWGVVQYSGAKKMNKELQDLKKDRAVLNENEVAVLVDKVGKLIVLPENEQPTIATVTDLEKLKNQSFFAHAKIGDKVLIFSASKKAILYRPLDNKIIEVAPLNIDDVQTTTKK